MKLTNQDLSKIFSLAKQNYVDLSVRDSDEQALLAECWVRAVASIVGLKENVEFPNRQFPDTED